MKSLQSLSAERCSLRCDLIMYIPESIILEVAARKIQITFKTYAKRQTKRQNAAKIIHRAFHKYMIKKLLRCLRNYQMQVHFNHPDGMILWHLPPPRTLSLSNPENPTRRPERNLERNLERNWFDFKLH